MSVPCPNCREGRKEESGIRHHLPSLPLYVGVHLKSTSDFNVEEL